MERKESNSSCSTDEQRSEPGHPSLELPHISTASFASSHGVFDARPSATFDTQADALGGTSEKMDRRRSSDGLPLLPAQGIKVKSEVKVEKEKCGDV